MNNALYAVVSGSVAAVERLEIMANNLANVNTAGFKAQYLVLAAEDTGDGTSASTTDAVDGSAVTSALRTLTDLSQGPIRQSGNSLDVALSGPGFFAVTTPAGERYTRQGQFQLDESGLLVTSAGYPVQSDSGSDLELPPGEIEIDASGGIRVDGNQVGSLRVVDLGSPEGVVAEGGALYAVTDEAAVTDVDEEDVSIVQGSIEMANVDVIRGLIELIDVARGYEAYMRASDQVNDTMEMAIQNVGGSS